MITTFNFVWKMRNENFSLLKKMKPDTNGPEDLKINWNEVEFSLKACIW
jgi:hypothetical protein